MKKEEEVYNVYRKYFFSSSFRFLHRIIISYAVISKEPSLYCLLQVQLLRFAKEY